MSRFQARCEIQYTVNYNGFQAPQKQESICVLLNTVYTRERSIKGLKEAALPNFFHSASPQLILLGRPPVSQGTSEDGGLSFLSVIINFKYSHFNKLSNKDESICLVDPKESKDIFTTFQGLFIGRQNSANEELSTTDCKIIITFSTKMKWDKFRCKQRHECQQ